MLVRALCIFAAAASIVAGQAALPDLPAPIDSPVGAAEKIQAQKADAEAQYWHSLAVSEDKQVSNIKDDSKEIPDKDLATPDEFWGFLMSRKHAWMETSKEGNSTKAAH